MPDELWALVERCWAQDMNARPSASEVLDWFLEDAAANTVVDEGTPRLDAMDEIEIEESERTDALKGLEAMEKSEEVIVSDSKDVVRSDGDTVLEKLDRLQMVRIYWEA